MHKAVKYVAEGFERFCKSPLQIFGAAAILSGLNELTGQPHGIVEAIVWLWWAGTISSQMVKSMGIGPRGTTW